eukprot:COSAG01_NODE_104_length_26171_cov_96.617612_17_plen_586_part_00
MHGAAQDCMGWLWAVLLASAALGGGGGGVSDCGAAMALPEPSRCTTMATAAGVNCQAIMLESGVAGRGATNGASTTMVYDDVTPAMAGKLSGYYSMSPKGWPGVSEQGRPVYHQGYCPNATSPDVCVGTHFLYHYIGHWLLARRLWAEPGSYHVVLQSRSHARYPDDAVNWHAVPKVDGAIALPSPNLRARCVTPRRSAAPQCNASRGAAIKRQLVRQVKAPHIVAQRSWRKYIHTFSLLDASACRDIVALAEEHAASRGGWLTARHGKHRTVDIQVDGHAAALNSRLRPTLAVLEKLMSSQRGKNADQITFRDVFVVKYDSDNGGQQSLKLHVDDSVVSFQLALNAHGTDFTGGGTYFQSMDCIAALQMGECITFPGKLIHGGAVVTAGVRYILVGFGKSRADRESCYDEPTGVSTGDPFRVVEGAMHGPRLQSLNGLSLMMLEVPSPRHNNDHDRNSGLTDIYLRCVIPTLILMTRGRYQLNGKDARPLARWRGLLWACAQPSKMWASLGYTIGADWIVAVPSWGRMRRSCRCQWPQSSLRRTRLCCSCSLQTTPSQLYGCKIPIRWPPQARFDVANRVAILR